VQPMAISVVEDATGLQRNANSTEIATIRDHERTRLDAPTEEAWCLPR
jgi:hypothetical protein